MKIVGQTNLFGMVYSQKHMTKPSHAGAAGDKACQSFPARQDYGGAT